MYSRSMEIRNESLRGIQGASDSMAIRSRNIANVNTPGYRAMDVVNSGGKTVGRPSAPVGGSVIAESPSSNQAPNNVDLTKDLVGLKTDELSAGYNLKAIKAQDRMNGTLLDLVG